MPDRFRHLLTRVPRVALAASLALAAACAPPPSPNEVNFSDEGMSQGVANASRVARSEVEDVAIGKSANDDGTIADEARTFDATDAVFASVRVTGQANSGIVRVVWFDPQGRPVYEQTRIVTPSRGEAVALQAKRDEHWKPGEHTVEVFLDDRLLATERFTVPGNAAQDAPGTAPRH
jgi:hypothetical protein